MGYEISQLQMQATSKNRIAAVLLPRLAYVKQRHNVCSVLTTSSRTIPINALLCRSITPDRLADDFTLQFWRTAAWIALSLLVSSMSTAIIAMGRSLEGFDIRAQTDFAMSTLGSRHSPGHTKFSQTNSAMVSNAYDRTPYDRTTKVDAGDASSDQMPILPEDVNREGVILVSRTVEHSAEHSK